MNIPKTNKVETCVFCTKEVLNNSFYKTEHFSAIYNIAPVLQGHSLIIPNNHYESLLDLSETELCEMMLLARKITQVLKTVFACDGFDWSIQDGVSAGQTIPHLHLHIIPRKLDDMPAGDEWYSKLKQTEHQMLDSKTRKKLNNTEFDIITTLLKQSAEAFIK